jgi:hypothetical protein
MAELIAARAIAPASKLAAAARAGRPILGPVGQLRPPSFMEPDVLAWSLTLQEA